MMSYVLAQDMDSSALNCYSIAQLATHHACILHCLPPLHPKRHLMIQHPCPQIVVDP
jgi:hypothetical protein